LPPFFTSFLLIRRLSESSSDHLRLQRIPQPQTRQTRRTLRPLRLVVFRVLFPNIGFVHRPWRSSRCRIACRRRCPSRTTGLADGAGVFAVLPASLPRSSSCPQRRVKPRALKSSSRVVRYFFGKVMCDSYLVRLAASSATDREIFLPAASCRSSSMATASCSSPRAEIELTF
jgi:hypothetical protein